MAKAKTESAIKAAHYRSRTANSDCKIAAKDYKDRDAEYKPLFKDLNYRFPTKNYRVED